MSSVPANFPLQPSASRPDAICPFCGRMTIIPTSHQEDHYTCRGCLQVVHLTNKPVEALAQRGAWLSHVAPVAVTLTLIALALIQFARSLR